MTAVQTTSGEGPTPKPQPGHTSDRSLLAWLRKEGDPSTGEMVAVWSCGDKWIVPSLTIHDQAKSKKDATTRGQKKRDAGDGAEASSTKRLKEMWTGAHKDGGTVAVRTGSRKDEAHMIVWHFQEDSKRSQKCLVVTTGFDEVRTNKVTEFLTALAKDFAEKGLSKEDVDSRKKAFISSLDVGGSGSKVTIAPVALKKAAAAFKKPAAASSPPSSSAKRHSKSTRSNEKEEEEEEEEAEEEEEGEEEEDGESEEDENILVYRPLSSCIPPESDFELATARLLNP
jgi:hypothetical protein